MKTMKSVSEKKNTKTMAKVSSVYFLNLYLHHKQKTEYGSPKLRSSAQIELLL